MNEIDNFDLKIMKELQKDSSLTVDLLADLVQLSRNACWRRIKRLEESGYITGKVALLDPEKLGLELSVMILIRTSNHEKEWLHNFKKVVSSMPEIVSAYRMSGDLDYVLRARVANVKAYDRMYQRLIEKLPLSDVSASFVMEEIKETTALPI